MTSTNRHGLEARIRVEPGEVILSVADGEMLMSGLNVVTEILANREMKESDETLIPVEIEWRSSKEKT
jgi:hypothetical protein